MGVSGPRLVQIRTGACYGSTADLIVHMHQGHDIIPIDQHCGLRQGFALSSYFSAGPDLVEEAAANSNACNLATVWSMTWMALSIGKHSAQHQHLTVLCLTVDPSLVPRSTRPSSTISLMPSSLHVSHAFIPPTLNVSRPPRLDATRLESAHCLDCSNPHASTPHHLPSSAERPP